jgi:hypothetical protein
MSFCFEASCEGLLQAILSEEDPPAGGADELYCAGKLKNKNPKIICSLDFSLSTFFASRQRKYKSKTKRRIRI